MTAMTTGTRGELLLVDDSPSSLTLLSLMLTQAGYIVREAPSGELAIRTLKVRVPELVLLDVRMPEMDGFEVCRRIKADAATSSLPVVFLSALGETTDKVLGLKIGAVDFLEKNFAQDEILARIDTHIALTRAKKALELERANLEQRVRERTEERLKVEAEKLALERALWQAKKMEAIGQLTGGIAHDFNHLLSLILGFAQLAQSAAASGRADKLADYLAEILKAGGEGQAVVAQLLAFSRTDERASEAIDVGAAVSETIASLSQAIDQTHVIDVSIEPNLPSVRIKPAQLGQIITNLLLNACDASPVGGRVIVVCRPASAAAPRVCSSCKKNLAGDYLMLSITDDGPGIAPGIIDNIFDPFFTTKDVGKGSGLGLSIVHGIVHSAGGHIEVAGKRGGGAEFRIYLPKTQLGAADAV